MRDWRQLAVMILVATGAMAQGTAPLARKAMEQQQAGQWQDAAGTWKQVVDANPYDTGARSSYALALLTLRQLDDAIPLYERMAAEGPARSTAMYNLACAHSLRGEADASLRWLSQALDHGFNQFELLTTDSDLDAAREDPRFGPVSGAVAPAGLSRDDKWRFDIDLLVKRVYQVHYAPEAHIARADFLAAAEALKQRVSALSDQRVLLGMQKLLASLGDGHTNMFGSILHRFPMHRYPIELYQFTDGVFIRSAADDATGLVGMQVLEIGGVPIAEAQLRAAPYCSVDNAMGLRNFTPLFLTFSETLEELGLIMQVGPVELTLAGPDGSSRKASVSPRPLGPADMHGNGALPEAVYANAKAPVPLPLYLKSHDGPQWFEFLPELSAVYFKFDAVINPPGSSLEQVFQELFALVDEKRARRLIIDVRDNGGGNNTLIQPLLHGLIRRPELSRRGNLFVITGRRTFSAAMNTVTRLEREVRPIYVGEPPASRPNFVGETTMVPLPANDVVFSCSSLYWQDAFPTDSRPWIAPHIVAELSSKDFAENRDPAMDAIAAEIRSTDKP